MVRINKEKAAKTAEFLFRYMVARYRCVGGSLSSGRIGLANEIRGGRQVFEGAIIVDADVNPPITNDREYQDFFIAIVKNGSGVVPELEPGELAEWRRYVSHGGPVPKWRQPGPTRDSTVPQDEKGETDLMLWMSRASGQVRQHWRTLFGYAVPKLLRVGRIANLAPSASVEKIDGRTDSG